MIAGAALAVLLAVPPPAQQSTADCSRPVFATDQLVCGDPALRELDRALGSALMVLAAAEGSWLEAQELWFKRRSRCAFEADHRGCAVAAYAERQQVVRPWLAGVAMQRVTCSDRRIDAVAFDEERVGFFSRGNLVGVATLAPSRAGWKPYLSATRSRSRIEAAGAAAGRLRCQLVNNRKQSRG